jgi:hypothetical protein
MAKCKPDYSAMTQEDFDNILEELAVEQGAYSLLSIPGVYEAVSEAFNNDILDLWVDRNPNKAYGVLKDGKEG